MSATPSDSFAFPVLIADVGGTNARFAVIERLDAPVRDLGRTPTSAHPDPLAAIRDFALPRAGERPRTAILALAAAIEGDAIPFTNCPWEVEPKRLVAELGFDEVIALNDFEALSLALPALRDDDLAPLGGGTARAGATMAVLGPGTGLGVATLARARGLWLPMPGEGGHVTLAPRGRREETIWHELERRHGRVGAEVVISGPGLAHLVAAIEAVDGREPRGFDAARITAAADAGDPVAEEAMAIFVSGLGRLAGDLALTVLPHGGVFIGGGIAPRILPHLADGRFRAAFEDKAPFRELIAGLSTRVITHPLPAFVGLAALARDPGAYAIDLEPRRWRR
jgi:glucokinase